MRAARRLIITLVVLFGLFVAADRISVSLAESKIAGKIQTARQLSRKPSVDIEGFPFLTQLAGGSLDHVKVHVASMTLQNSETQSVDVTDFQADLRQVKLEDDYSEAVAKSATGTALVSYAQVSALLQGHPTLSYAGNGRVRVALTVPGLDRKVSLTAGLDVENVNIGLTSASGVSGLSGIPGISGSTAQGLVSHYLATGAQFQISGLPMGLMMTRAQPGPDGVTVSVGGTGVSLSDIAG